MEYWLLQAMITNFTWKNKTALFRRDETLGKTMTLAGPKAWTVDEVITLCEKYADAEADVSLPNALHQQADLQRCLFLSYGRLCTHMLLRPCP